MKLSDMKKRMETLKNMKELIESRSDTTDNPNPEYIKYPTNIYTSAPGGARGYSRNQRLKKQLRNEELRHILTNYPESRRQDMEDMRFVTDEMNKKIRNGEKTPKLPVFPLRDLPFAALNSHRYDSSRRKLYMDSGHFNPDLTDEQLETAFKIMLQKRGGKYDPDYGRALLRKKKVKKAKPKRKSVKRCKCK